MTADVWLDESGAIGQIPLGRALSVLRRTPPGVRVLGADGFTAIGHPTLDFIADFSRVPMSAEETVAAAIDILSSWPGDLLVELVVCDE